MKQKLLFTVLFAVVTFTLSTNSHAADCDDLFNGSIERQVRADSKCKNMGRNVGDTIRAKVQVCREYRKAKRSCRQKFRNEKFMCRRAKMHQCMLKNKCDPKARRVRNLRGVCLQCYTSFKNDYKLDLTIGAGDPLFVYKCDKTCRKYRRVCMQRIKSEKKACLQKQRGSVLRSRCKSARKIARQAGGRWAKCAIKHYGKAVLACIKLALDLAS